MKSIIERNTLSSWKHRTDWHYRVEEIPRATEARLTFLAQHHTARALEHIAVTNRAATAFSAYGSMPIRDLDSATRRAARESARGLFNSVVYRDRLEPAEAAIEKLAAGSFCFELLVLDDVVWSTLHKFEQLRRNYDVPFTLSSQRFFMGLADEITPLCDGLKNSINEFYAAAQTHYGLPDFDAEVLQ